MGPQHGLGRTDARQRAAVSRRRAGSTVGDVVVALWRIARPPIWMVSLVPLWVGHLLATRTIFPGFDRWTRFWAHASQSGAHSGDFWDTFRHTLTDARPLLLAVVVLGPVAWAAALSINDVHDLAGDSDNPRKQKSPLVDGAVSPAFVQRAAYGFAMVALTGAAADQPFPVVRVAGEWDALLRGKGRVALTSLPEEVQDKIQRPRPLAARLHGAGCRRRLAGRHGVRRHRPQRRAGDRRPDLAAGYDTLATRLGYRGAYRIGYFAWAAACGNAVVLSALDVVIPRQMLFVLVLAAPVLVAAYHLLIGRARGPAQLVRGIVVISWLFLVPNVMFALLYTGLWVPGSS